jgi:ATP-binding cassette, subfamily B, bacterial MsbA
LNGRPLSEYRLRDIRRYMTVVTQQTMLFQDTVLNNICYGVPHATEADVIRAAKQAYAHNFIVDQLEQGYDTMIGEHGGRLSGGQRQRIALARAILRNSPLLILDEATSQVDPESEVLIHRTLKQLIQNRSTIMITHRFSTLDLADRILVLQEGTAVDIGTHNELMARCDVYQRLRSTEMRESA